MTSLRIRPDLPLTWEDPDTIRIGFDRVVARVSSPSAGQQRLIGKLLVGIDAARVHAEVRGAGATPGEGRALLTALTPVIRQRDADARGESGPPLKPGPVPALLSDGGQEVPALRQVLHAAQICRFDGPAEAASLVLYVERFLEPLERAQQWLIAEQPHALIRFTDTRAFVGPIVSAAGAPCHTCGSLALLAQDASLPVIAAQLVGRRPASETRDAAVLVAGLVGQFVGAWRRGEQWVHSVRLEVPVDGGIVSGNPRRSSVAPHPDCMCGNRGEQPRPVPLDQTGLADES